MPAKKRLKHDLFNPEERDYWKNVHVNIDAICDKWEDRYQNELIQLVEKLPDEIIKASVKHYKLSKGPAESETGCLLSNKKASIDFFCLLAFALYNPKKDDNAEDPKTKVSFSFLFVLIEELFIASEDRACCHSLLLSQHYYVSVIKNSEKKRLPSTGSLLFLLRNL